MPRIKLKLSEKSLKTINNFLNSIVTLNGSELDIFSERYMSFFMSEYKTLKEYQESVIVDKYLEATNDIVNSITDGKWSDDYFDAISANARLAIAIYYTGNKSFDDIIDIYFNEVKREYILHPMNESDHLEFIPENRDIFIKNNLKLVVNCAKRYRYLVIPFEDLIQNGNIGLLEAFNRFDTTKSKVRSEIIELINASVNDSFTKEEAQTILRSKLTYGKNIEIIYSSVPNEGFQDKNSFINWTKLNVKTAVFASVAFKWIQGAILSSLSKSHQVSIPYNKLASGYTNFLSLDQMSPQTNDDNSNTVMSHVNDEHLLINNNDIESSEYIEQYKQAVNDMLSCLNDDERRIIRKRFGIGFPSPLSFQEIGKQEGISNVAARKIINSALDKLSSSITDNNKAYLKEILF